MAIKIDGQDLLKRYINGQEIVRVYKNRGEIRPNTVPPTPPVFDNYLCFTATDRSLEIKLKKSISPLAPLPDIALETSTDKITRTDYTFGSNISVPPRQKLYWRNKSDVPTLFSNYYSNLYFETSFSLGFYVSGDVTSLLCKTGTTILTGDGCFRGLFVDNARMLSCPELPATTLTNECYRGMFNRCIRLEAIPELPATILPNKCYYLMFGGCEKIKLSATQDSTYITPYRIPSSGTGTIGSNSLDYMFIDTGGTFTGTPTINTTYYTSNTVI